MFFNLQNFSHPQLANLDPDDSWAIHNVEKVADHLAILVKELPSIRMLSLSASDYRKETLYFGQKILP